MKIILYNQKRLIHRFYTFLSPYVILHDRETFLPITLGQFCKIVYVHQPTNKKLKKLNLVNNSIATLNNLCELQTQKKKKNIKKNICTCFLSISLSIRISSSSCSNWNKYFFPLQATIKNKHRSKAKRDVLKNRHSENFWKFIRKSLKCNPPLAKILRYWKRTLLYIFLGIFRKLWVTLQKTCICFSYIVLRYTESKCSFCDIFNWLK